MRNPSLSPIASQSIAISFIILVAIVPLFFNLPFRDNIYLTWEGAYRMYKGQMPFVDFGMPLGYGFWLFPTLSFSLFGPYLTSLIKIQVLVNIIAGISFMTIARSFLKDPGAIALIVILFVLSYSFFNYWPWYNHMVIVYEFVGLASLIAALSDKLKPMRRYVLLIFSALFIFLSFFTKQDGGAFAILISISLLLVRFVFKSDLKTGLIFLGSLTVIAAGFILPLIPHDFGYWFNYGQVPHYSRVDVLDLLTAFFGGSPYIKLYLLIVFIIVVSKSTRGLKWWKDEKEILHLILTLGILFQAAVMQVTSYVPADVNVFFHSFAILYFLAHIEWNFSFAKVKFFIPLTLLIGLWWSGNYWKYANRIFYKYLSGMNKDSGNIVSVNSYTIESDTTVLDKSTWGFSPEKPFSGVKMPAEAIEAIERLKLWKANYPVKNPKILNMSELTPLAEVMPYDLETDMPLWYHLNVAMFERELEMFSSRIDNQYYDLVLFEYLPALNNFYPFAVRESLKTNYKLWFKFQAPRELTTESIEVYIRKQ